MTRDNKGSAAAPDADAAFATLMAEFLTGDRVEVRWLQALEGDRAVVTAAFDAANGARIESVRFLDDGIRQVRHAEPFDALRCLAVLRRGVDEVEGKG